MNMTYVTSSNIEAVGYEENTGVLEIDFLDGSAYLYFDVPSFIYYELVEADSKGRYAYKNIYKVYNQEKIR